MKTRSVGERAKVSGLGNSSRPGRERSAWLAHLAWEGAQGALDTCRPASYPPSSPGRVPWGVPLSPLYVSEGSESMIAGAWDAPGPPHSASHCHSTVTRQSLGTYTWALGRGSRWGNLRPDGRLQTGKQTWGPGDPGEHTEFSQEGQRSPVTARKPHCPSVMPTLPGPKEPDPGFGLEA